MTKDKINDNVEEVELNDEQLEEKKIFLMACELQKDDSDMEMAEYTAQLDANIPTRLLDDNITQMEKDIKSKIFKDKNGEDREATETELELMKIKLITLKKMKKADLPMRDLRLKIHQVRKRKEAIDSPDNQIKKLEREIKTKKAWVPKSRQPQAPTMSGIG